MGIILVFTNATPTKKPAFKPNMILRTNVPIPPIPRLKAILPPNITARIIWEPSEKSILPAGRLQLRASAMQNKEAKVRARFFISAILLITPAPVTTRETISMIRYIPAGTQKEQMAFLIFNLSALLFMAISFIG